MNERARSVRWLCLTCGWHTDTEMPGFGGSGGTEHRHWRGNFGCGPLIGLLIHGHHDFCGGTGLVLYAGEGDYCELRTCTCNPIQRTVGESRIPVAFGTSGTAGRLQAV